MGKGGGDARTRGVGANEGIENVALVVGLKELARIVLPVYADQQRADLRQHRRGDGCAVDPRARSTIRADLALQHQHIIVGIDATRIERSAYRIAVPKFEDAFNRCLFGACANTIGGGAFAKQHAECTDDERFPRPGFTS